MATMTTERKKTKAAAPIAPEERAPAPAVKTVVEVRALEVEVPFVASTKYAQQRVDLSLTHDQAVVLRGILEGLQERHARANKGARQNVIIDDSQGAICWLIEEVGRARGQPDTRARGGADIRL